jgi:hypothetical protein
METLQDAILERTIGVKLPSVYSLAHGWLEKRLKNKLKPPAPMTKHRIEVTVSGFSEPDSALLVAQ